MQIVFIFFSNNVLNFDFFSRIPADKINLISSTFLSIISSIIILILSLALEIIISFSLSKNDLDKILSKKFSLFSKISFSSYLLIFFKYFCSKYFCIISFFNPSFSPYKR